MISTLPLTAWILLLAVLYLVVVYSVLWWAKRSDETKRRIF